MAEPGTGKTILVALAVAVACSLAVSLTAVILADRQQANRNNDLMQNVLTVAGLYDPDVPVSESFERLELRIVDLETGAYVTSEEIGQGTYDQAAAPGDLELSVALPSTEDPAGLGRREKYSYVGLVREGDRIDLIVFPVRGKGLWSTMRAFVALDGDLTTVRGLAFYQHGETAGLGGEITNPRWLAQWPGKQVYDDEGELRIEVSKGAVPASAPDADHRVDGISGATITGDGVTHLMRYWFGDAGFKPYLQRLRREGGSDGCAQGARRPDRSALQPQPHRADGPGAQFITLTRSYDDTLTSIKSTDWWDESLSSEDLERRLFNQHANYKKLRQAFGGGRCHQLTYTDILDYDRFSAFLLKLGWCIAQADYDKVLGNKVRC